MIDSSPKHGSDQRSLAEAYRFAASVHNLTAQKHEKNAECDDKKGEPRWAQEKRHAARVERRNAAVDRRQAARNSSSESGTPDSQEPKGVDLAALLGAAVTVLLTLTFGAGAWGPLSTIIGSLLLVIMLAFFWRRRISARRRRSSAREPRVWESFFVGLALSAVVGLLGAITAGEAFQKVAFSDNGKRFQCRSVAVAQATTTVHDLNEARAQKNLLQGLIDDTLLHGTLQTQEYQPMARILKDADKIPRADAAVRYVFYREYESVLGDCLANETLNSLWGIGVFCVLLTLIWWSWNLVPIFRKRFVGALYRRSHMNCLVAESFLTIKCQAWPHGPTVPVQQQSAAAAAHSADPM